MEWIGVQRVKSKSKSYNIEKRLDERSLDRVGRGVQGTAVREHAQSILGWMHRKSSSRTTCAAIPVSGRGVEASPSNTNGTKITIASFGLGQRVLGNHCYQVILDLDRRNCNSVVAGTAAGDLEVQYLMHSWQITTSHIE